MLPISNTKPKTLRGQPGHVPPKIEKRLWFHQLLPSLSPNLLVAPDVFDKSAPVHTITSKTCHLRAFYYIDYSPFPSPGEGEWTFSSVLPSYLHAVSVTDRLPPPLVSAELYSSYTASKKSAGQLAKMSATQSQKQQNVDGKLGDCFSRAVQYRKRHTCLADV